MANITALSIAEILPAVKLLASHLVKNVNNTILTKTEILGDLRDKHREFLIDDLLIHLISIISLVKRWRHQKVKTWLGLYIHEVLGHFMVVRQESFLVPLIVFGVIGAKHEEDYVSIA